MNNAVFFLKKKKKRIHKYKIDISTMQHPKQEGTIWCQKQTNIKQLFTKIYQ